ncbi:MAG: hypothetical protein LDL16_01090 [Thiobacillus sp.]|nr:hypothetical protein [Thiobacillus sp.]
MAEYNEDAYKRARQSVITHSCPFERALLSRCVSCARSKKLNLAEREAIACGDPEARESCLAFYRAVHENAQFALKIAPGTPWPFGKEIRAQCGGVRGLAVTQGGVGDETCDVAATVLQALSAAGSIDALPYSEIMRAVVHYEPRKRRG